MAIKRSNPKKIAETSRNLVNKGKELLQSSRQALEFSRVVLAEAEERAAKKQTVHAQAFLAPKDRQ
ncbi:MAG: hypothetical protein JWO13_1462 [Acidobacteriales bacterium]|nr:hypothetical protein [Terriglobales bacterium]